jgi:phage head maturation protease
LQQVDLWEVSLVTFPMLEGARVSDWKREAKANAERAFRPDAAMPHPEERRAPSLATLFRDGARIFQPGVK